MAKYNYGKTFTKDGNTNKKKSTKKLVSASKKKSRK